MKANKLIIASTLVFSLALPPSAIAAEKTSTKAAGPSTKTVVNTILSGVGAPSKTVGINGDFYIDTKNLNLYGPKTKGVWKISTSLRAKEVSTSTNIVSEAVATGATGAKGEKGATGDKGPQGPAGVTGARGEVGAQGPAGAAGARGEAGIAGSAGATGPAGARGEAGATGPAGATGARGEVGATGATGPAGARGEVGAQGPAGARGEIGAPGSTGAQGPAGAPGVSYTKFATVPNIVLATGSEGNSNSGVFFTAPTTGSYTFEVLVSGVISVGNQFRLYAEITSGSMSIGNQFAVASDSNSGVNGYSGRQYGFRIIGAMADVSAGTTFSIKIGTLTAVDTSITFSGRALVNKVGSIG
jgi:hypothetical protein